MIVEDPGGTEEEEIPLDPLAGFDAGVELREELTMRVNELLWDAEFPVECAQSVGHIV